MTATVSRDTVAVSLIQSRDTDMPVMSPQRLERRRREATFPKCKCGNTLRKDSPPGELCPSCAEAADLRAALAKAAMLPESYLFPFHQPTLQPGHGEPMSIEAAILEHAAALRTLAAAMSKSSPAADTSDDAPAPAAKRGRPAKVQTETLPPAATPPPPPVAAAQTASLSAERTAAKAAISDLIRSFGRDAAVKALNGAANISAISDADLPSFMKRCESIKAEAEATA